MGIFNFGRKEATDEASTPPQTQPELDDVLLRALLNGETITRDKALMLPVVSSAVDFIGGAVACMPVKLYHYKKIGERRVVEEVERDSRVRMLNGDTGDTLNAFEMKKAMVEDFLLGKGGYAYIDRHRNDVVGIHYVQDVYVEAFTNVDPIFKRVTFLVGDRNIASYNMLKLLRNTKNGATGKGLIEEVSRALETAFSTMMYQLGLVRSGGSKKGFLKSDKKLDQDAIDKLKEAWRKLYAQNEENVVVLNNGLEFQEASSTSVEMQLDQNKKTLSDEINSIFHIDKSDFNLTFKEAIYPIVKAFETALNSTLLLESEKKNFFFELDVKEIVRANLKERFEAYRMAKETGFMTINEIRRAENMNYIEGMDVINVGLNAVLYDINTHQYYNVNANTHGNTTGETIEGAEETDNENNNEGGENEVLQEPNEE